MTSPPKKTLGGVGLHSLNFGNLVKPTAERARFIETTVSPPLQGVSFRDPYFQGTETPYFMKHIVFLPNKTFGCIYYLLFLINPSYLHFSRPYVKVEVHVDVVLR